jgi:type IV secretion system protein VirB3
MPGKVKYPSYNGLARVAMWKGVPLMAVVVIAVACLLIGTLASLFMGVGGILFASVGIPVAWYFKEICEKDDQALRITLLELKCRLTRRNAKHFGNTYTLAPVQYGRRQHVYKRYFAKPASK